MQMGVLVLFGVGLPVLIVVSAVYVFYVLDGVERED
jgi:hypothetical protein